MIGGISGALVTTRLFGFEIEGGSENQILELGFWFGKKGVDSNVIGMQG